MPNQYLWQVGAGYLTKFAGILDVSIPSAWIRPLLPG